ncbi:MAG: glycosyltransferase family 39 protein [Parcubacteria group bacterium]|nr:glycosyltransferase family 39 protein [Parcubacteria group bacterium]
MKSKWAVPLLLILIIIIATFLRLYNLKEWPPGLYPDEAVNGNNALEVLRTTPPAGGFKVFYPENNGREGLFINIQAMFLKYFGVNEPWVLRLPSAIFGILTVLGLYFLTKELFQTAASDKQQATSAGLLASFFLATSFWHINFSRIGFRAIMAPFFLVWAIYFLLQSLKTINYKLQAILGGVFYGLGFYSYIAYRITPLFVGFIPIYRFLRNKDGAERKKILLSTFYFLLSTFIVALPIGIYFLEHPADFFGRTSEVSIFSSTHPLSDLGLNIVKTAAMFNWHGDWNWRHNYAGKPELFWPVGILFLTGILGGAWKALRQKQYFNPEMFSFIWIATAALPVVISNEGVPHALRSLLMAPPVFILAASGGLVIYAFVKKYSRLPSNIISAYVIVFLTLLALEAVIAYASWALNPATAESFSANYVAIGRELNALPQTVPKYVLVKARGVEVRGIPMPAQTVMFITDTFSPQNQKVKNIHYVLPQDESEIPQDAYKVTIQ